MFNDQKTRNDRMKQKHYQMHERTKGLLVLSFIAIACFIQVIAHVLKK